VSRTRPEFTDSDWDVLLDRIQQGDVVPIIGSDLLTIERTGEQGFDLDQELAQMLAEELGIESSSAEPTSVSAVASEYLRSGRKRSDFQQTLDLLMRKFEDEPAPAPSSRWQLRNETPRWTTIRTDGARVFLT